MTEKYQCPLCAGQNVLSKYADASLPIRECNCGMVFLMPIPTDPELREMYGEEYYSSWGISSGKESLPATMKKETFRGRLQKLSSLLQPGKVLDVGCATGFFLEAATDAGWEAYGVELSPFSSAVAQQKFGGRVLNGTLEQAGFSDGYFDLITLSDLLEHVPQPDAFLDEGLRILKPGGYLMIITPDVRSLSATLMGRSWSHYKAEHLLYFSKKTLKQLLKRHGFEAVYVGTSAKYLNLTYVVNQFKTYPHPLLTPLVRLLECLLPESIRLRNFPIPCGEMMGVFRKPEQLPVSS